MAKWLGGGNLVPPGALCHCRDFRPNGPGEAGRWRTDRTDDAARRGVEGHRLVVADYPSTADAATHFRLIAQVRDQRPERVYRRDTAGDRRIREPVQCLDQKVVEIWVSLLRPEAEDNLGEQRCAREGGQVVSDALTATKQGEAGEREEIGTLTEIELGLSLGEWLQQSPEAAAGPPGSLRNERAEPEIRSQHPEDATRITIGEAVQNQCAGPYDWHSRRGQEGATVPRFRAAAIAPAARRRIDTTTAATTGFTGDDRAPDHEIRTLADGSRSFPV
jgi:hypothetical protein